MSTCNRLDLQTLGSQPIMPKNLPDHWIDMPNLVTEILWTLIYRSSLVNLCH